MIEREDRISWQQGDVKVSQCADCVHKHLDSPTCEAFPDGIPREILLMEHDHRKPYPDDNGIRYKPIKR